jgi:hypothetical protein
LVWFDSTLKGKWGSERKEKGEEELGLKAVRVWLMGAEKWIELDEWPPNSSYETLYLSSTNALTSQPSDEVERTTTFRYDPADPTPSVGGAVINSHPGMRNQVKIEERNDVLVFTGPTLETNLDIVGTPVVNLHISATLESWDVVARLCDVDEWGRSTNVCEGIWRHAGNSKAGEPIRLELWPTAHRFKPRHKMRLQIAGAAHPRWGRNLGADGLNAEADDMRACNYVLHNSTGQESYLELPVWLPQD